MEAVVCCETFREGRNRKVQPVRFVCDLFWCLSVVGDALPATALVWACFVSLTAKKR